jgi:hypothetical protein
MSQPKVYADFQNLDGDNRLRLTCVGTREDLARQGIELREGLVLTFYMDDANDRGEPDELRSEGAVHYNGQEGTWVASIDWTAIRHASDEGNAGGGDTIPPDPGPTSQVDRASQGGGPPSAAVESRC